MIKFDKVYVKYVNDFYSLFDCNCSIDCNTVLHEKNLCGATAFMRTLSKIDKTYNGEIFIDDLNLKNINDKDLNIAYLPQNPVLFKNKTVEYNLKYPLKIRKINKNIVNNQLNLLIFEYKLNNFNKKIKNLNLSEQKIISLLRALLRKPKYILLENFFENLDKSYYDFAIQILIKIKENSIIIACKKSYENFEFFKDFNNIEI